MPKQRVTAHFCPLCSEKAKVLQTRWQGAYIRDLACQSPDCGHRYSTREVVIGDAQATSQPKSIAECGFAILTLAKQFGLETFLATRLTDESTNQISQEMHNDQPGRSQAD